MGRILTFFNGLGLFTMRILWRQGKRVEAAWKGAYGYNAVFRLPDDGAWGWITF